MEAAQALALRVWKEGGADDRAKMIYAFRLCTGRRPDAFELQHLLALLREQQAYFAGKTAAAVYVSAADLNNLPEDVDLHQSRAVDRWSRARCSIWTRRSRRSRSDADYEETRSGHRGAEAGHAAPFFQGLRRRTRLDGARLAAQRSGSVARPRQRTQSADPLAPKKPHFAPKAKRVIYLFQAGAPSQLDLFDYKPGLAKYNGKPVPAGSAQGADVRVHQAGCGALRVGVQVREARAVGRGDLGSAAASAAGRR